MNKHSQSCQCRTCRIENEDTDKITYLPKPSIDYCRYCHSPVDFENQLQALCVALLDIQTGATVVQKADHGIAIEIAKELIRDKMNRIRASFDIE